MDDFLTEAREEAVKWAKEITSKPFVVLDTETTGMNHDDVIVSIGIVSHSGDVLLDTYVKPWKPIPQKATDIHGITDEMVKDAPTILDLEPKLLEILGDLPIVIYNVDFDRRMLQQSFVYSGLDPLPSDHWTRRLFTWKEQRPVECAMNRYAEYFGDWNDYRQSFKWQKLVYAAKAFEISTDGAHGAVADCLMTLGVVKGMATNA